MHNHVSLHHFLNDTVSYIVFILYFFLKVTWKGFEAFSRTCMEFENTMQSSISNLNNVRCATNRKDWNQSYMNKE